MNEPVYNKETKEWEVHVGDGVYSFKDIAEAEQFINLQAVFVKEGGDYGDNR